MQSTISQFLTMNILRLKDEYKVEWIRVDKIGSLKISFVDIQDIIKDDEEVIEALKENIDESLFNQEVICGNENSKYVNDLFYIAPLYHRKMSNLKKILFLDIDISVNHHIKKLWVQFQDMEDKSNVNEEISSKCIGLGLDLSPHYYHRLVDYIAEHPDTDLGSPGKLQGYNTGVVLFNLDCLRKSELEKIHLQPKKVKLLLINVVSSASRHIVYLIVKFRLGSFFKSTK